MMMMMRGMDMGRVSPVLVTMIGQRLYPPRRLSPHKCGFPHVAKARKVQGGDQRMEA